MTSTTPSDSTPPTATTPAPSRNQVIGAFVLNNDFEYPWPVTVRVPSNIPGEHVEQQFVAVFRHISPEERAADVVEFDKAWRNAEAISLRQARGEAITEAEQETLRTAVPFEVALLRKALVRLQSGILDTGGTDISALPGTREAVMRNQWARVALFRAYMASLRERDPAGN